MSSTTVPISPTAFAAALHDLPLSTLHLKAAELRNSIAHLDYSNEQLRPFALGTEPGITGPDQDCIDAIRENEGVIERREEQIRLLKAEVEGRGMSWGEWDADALKREEEGRIEGDAEDITNGLTERSSAWSDGTFQTGRIVNGEVEMDGISSTTTAINGNATGSGNRVTNGVNGTTTSSEVNGTAAANAPGGRLDDAALRRAVEERMRDLATDDADEGLHL